MENEKRLESMTERELLVELVRRQNDSNRIRKLILAFIAVIMAGLIITAVMLIPQTLKTIDDAKELIAKTETAMNQFDEMVDDIESLTLNANKIVKENADVVSQIMEKLNNIDFTSLNQSIRDLSGILEPLAAFFRGM